MTNGDRIRNMSDLELTAMLMCPYDATGREIPCAPNGIQAMVPKGSCMECMENWLKSEAKER